MIQVPGCLVTWWSDVDINLPSHPWGGRVQRVQQLEHACLVLLHHSISDMAHVCECSNVESKIVLMGDALFQQSTTFLKKMPFICCRTPRVFRSLDTVSIESCLTELMQRQQSLLSTTHPLTILIPYRNRALHFAELLAKMQTYCPEARIILVNQVDSLPFNAGAIRNIAFQKAIWMYPETSWVCFMDVDNVPLSKDVVIPKPNAKQVIKVFGHYHSVGGIWTINANDFLQVDGYPSNFWSWGMEDMLLQRRLCLVGGIAIQQPTYVRGCQTAISDPQHDREYSSASRNLRKFEQGEFVGLSETHFNVESESFLPEFNAHIIRIHITNPTPLPEDL